MAQDDDRPSRFSGTAGLVFAYVCFALSIGTIAAAIYLLPATREVKLFLAAGAALLTSMFGFLAVAAFMVMRGKAAHSSFRGGEAEPGIGAGVR